MKADFPIREGYRLETSSREHLRTSSLTSESREETDGVRGEADGSEFDCLEGILDCFFDFEGISAVDPRASETNQIAHSRACETS